ncbi:MFS transporter [Halorhabdus amylolytica]|uniref:MFS transporter n=1 Tax=Halorhabdus amylolytica TaxID=2559573 RepID=UPI00200AF2D4|nr:MFS transporter [Halorhabdus amylolytica]
MSTRSGANGSLVGGSRGRLLLSVAVGWFLVLGMRFVLPALLPTISNEFDLTEASAGFAVTVLWVTYAAMQFPTGLAVDRVGERLLLVASAVLSGLALLTYWVAPTFTLVLVATGLFGLGTGLYGPSRGTLLSRTFTDREGAAFGTVLGAGSVGAAALPLLATLVAAVYGWRAAMVAVVPLFALVAIVLWMTVPPRDDGTHEGPGVRRTVRRLVASFHDRRIVLAVTGATLMLFGFQALTAFLVTYLHQVKHLSTGTAGAILSGLFVVGALSQAGGGLVADRFGQSRTLAAIAIVSVPPLLALPNLDGRLALAVVGSLTGVRMSVGPLINAYIVGTLPDDVEGTAWGLLRTGFFAIGSLGSTVVGVLATMALFDEAFYLLAALTVLAAVIFLTLPARARPSGAS